MSNFQKIVAIDTSRIDEELEQHGQKFMEWAEKYAAAEREMMAAERSLKILKAEISDRIRESPEKYNLDKATEVAIKNKMLQNKKVGAAYERCEQAKYDLEVMRAMRDEMGNNRKKMLEKLVDLLISGILSDPRLKREGDGGEERRSKLKQKLMNRRQRHE